MISIIKDMYVGNDTETTNTNGVKFKCLAEKLIREQCCDI